MSAYLSIVNLTFRSIMRSHVFQMLLFILLMTIIFLPVTVVGDGTALAQIQVSLKYCLGVVSFILSLSSVWIGCITMSKDIENYQLHMVISKPVSRLTIWLGKFTGILIIHSILLFISALLVYILVLCQFRDQMFLKYTQWPLGIIMGLSGVIFILIILFWLNNYFLKIFRIRFIKSDNKQFQLSSFFFKSWLGSLLVLIISSLLFFALNWQFDKDTFSLRDKAKIQSAVLVGRRVFMPVKPDMKKAVMAEFEKRVSQLPAQYRKNLPDFKKNEMLYDIKELLKSRLVEVPAGRNRYWIYEGLNPKNKTPIYVRYRAYIGKISTKKQRETMGVWGTQLYIPEQDVDKKSNNKKALRSVFAFRSTYPEKIMCGIFHEFIIPPNSISSEGKAVVGFSNFDPQRKTVFFQTADGPKLLVKVTGFINNYCRGVLIIFLKLALLTGLACSLGGLTSAPVAIFTVISYLLIGSMLSYLGGIQERMYEETGPLPSMPFFEELGNIIGKVLNFLIVPMQNFEVSHLLSGGELIEWSFIWNILFFNVILRGLPIILVGIWFFKRREMGLVIKK